MKNKNRAWEESSALPANRANRNSLAALGRLASAFRNAGMRSVFNGIRDALDAVVLRLDLPSLGAEIDGIRLRGFLRHRSFLENLARGTYEPCTRKLFFGLLAETDVFVDAGAHIGLFSVLASRRGTSDLSVISFEPDPYNGKALHYNLRKNRCANVRMLPMAVSDTTGTARFLISDGTLGSSLILGRTNIGATHYRLVPTAAPDFTLQEIPLKSLLIKLDVEGGEIMALRGYVFRASASVQSCNDMRNESPGTPSRGADSGRLRSSSPQSGFGNVLYFRRGRRLGNGVGNVRRKRKFIMPEGLAAPGGMDAALKPWVRCQVCFTPAG